MRYPGFIHGSYESQAVTADQERTVNWYLERMESRGATSEAALYPTPGVAVILQPTPAANTPEAPLVTNLGVPGTTTYSYKLVALLADGVRHTAAGLAGTTVTGGSNLFMATNRLTWPAAFGAVTYAVYRTVGTFIFRAPQLIGTTAALTFDDTGIIQIDDEVPPTTDTTGTVAVPSGPGLAHFFQAGREFAVIGTVFYEIGVFGAYTSRGTVAIGANPATISSNGDGGGQLFITSGDNGYIFDLGTDVLSQVAALNGKATMGDYLDGYFLVLDAADSKLYISNLLDGLTWDTGTAFAQRSRASDPWLAMRVNGIYVWLIGEHTSEPWYNTGASPFPLAPYPSLLIPHGTGAPFSAAVGDGMIVWLGASKIGAGYVLKASGFSPEVISDFPRQLLAEGYVISDAHGEIFKYQGHVFYLLTFPTEDVTWAYDMQTGAWTEWLTWISERNEFIAWRPRWHAMAYGEHRMLDASTGHVYRMASNLGLDVDGLPIRRLRRAPALTAENQCIFYSAFELDLEPGLGTSTGQGQDPQVMLRWSDDGGKTWGPELLRSAGKIGKYLQRVIWNRLGSARRRVFEVTVSDPNPWRLTAAYLTLGQPLKGVSKQPQQASA